MAEASQAVASAEAEAEPGKNNTVIDITVGVNHTNGFLLPDFRIKRTFFSFISFRLGV